jgi:2-dehydro-3-deoxyphosphooctonate aldolase (KDO 8-P synthase)
VAAGADGFFFEVHPTPEQALCDGPNALPLSRFEPLLRQLLRLHALVREEA